MPVVGHDEQRFVELQLQTGVEQPIFSREFWILRMLSVHVPQRAMTTDEGQSATKVP